MAVPKQVRLHIGIKRKLSQSLEDEIVRLDSLIDTPTTLQRLLRAAAAETLLAAYRTRFLENLSDALNMRRESKFRGTPKDTQAIKKAKKRIDELAMELANSHLNGHSIAGMERRIEKAEAALVRAYDTHFGKSPLSTGQFRPLALKVLALLTDVANLGEQANPDSVGLGIGNFEHLDQVRTPSATPLLTGHPTSSPMSSLWRHLEFGTGVFASANNTASQHRTTFGTWWYGPRPGFGLQLKGSKGVHAIFDQRGVGYEVDALRFETVFAEMLTRALHG